MLPTGNPSGILLPFFFTPTFPACQVLKLHDTFMIVLNIVRTIALAGNPTAL
ncbi:hypothetical protein A33Q_1839 [Indibacter alkaliphilus LW1]|uniref:Uncharacterized protein n=1 Tax=Indibacter alkaliphilus (strain CCUG 57479 / KCTC 22604 / LW1) TaxID=1189612 RepID=S2DXR0_INDAL|nr:hypothetical protein A33Q_1839 [Indibacter alkaliphilus LW1]